MPFFEEYKSDLRIYLEDDTPLAQQFTSFAIHYPSELSTYALPYYSIGLNSDMHLREIEVYTQLPNRKKVRLSRDEMTTSVGMDDNIFVNDNVEIKLPFKSLQPGATVYVEYTIDYDELRYSRPLYFNLFLDAQSIDYTLEYPETMDIKLLRKNMQGANVNENSKARRGTVSYDFNVEGAQRLEYFDDGPSVPYYVPHVIPIVLSYSVAGKKHPYLSSVDDLYAYYMSIVYRNGDTTTTEHEEIAKEIKSKSKDKTELIRNTYNWVKKNIRYVAYEAGDDGIIPRSPAKVCSRKFGDCKDMSNLMRKLLALNGIESHLTWVGTRHIPYTYQELYTMNTDNHMILAVSDPAREWIFLDATDPGGKYGLPTQAIQGKQALIGIDDSHYELFSIPLIPKESNGASYKVDMDIDDVSLKISSEIKALGLSASRLSSLMLYTNEKEKEKLMLSLLEVNQNQTKVLDSDVINTEESIEIKNSYKSEGRVKRVGGYYFVDPYVASIMPWGTLDTADRTLPKDIELNRINSNQMTLMYPSHYELSTVPSDVEFQGDNFSFKLNFYPNKRSLLVKEELIIDSPDLFWDVDDIKKWNELIAKLKNVYSTPLKLSKI